MGINLPRSLLLIPTIKSIFQKIVNADADFAIARLTKFWGIAPPSEKGYTLHKAYAIWHRKLPFSSKPPALTSFIYLSKLYFLFPT